MKSQSSLGSWAFIREEKMIHKPVLLEEVIENLNLKPGMTVIDGTLGAGGHSIEILKKILPGGKLVSIDWDKQAIENFPERLKKEGFDISDGASPASVKSNFNGDRCDFKIIKKSGGNNIAGYWCGASDNYANLNRIIGGLPDVSSGIDAVFADLGFSSDQIEDAKRGFSFLKNGPLDMRYSPEKEGLTATDIVNGYSEKDLADIFWKYGEEKYARRFAKEIVSIRKTKKIVETGELVEIISRAIPNVYRRKKIYPVKSRRAGLAMPAFNRVNFATKVFQALRIEVNHELENLKEFLDQSLEVLASGGRLAVVSFHSIEDRLVKNFFRDESRDCICLPSIPKCVCTHKKKLKIITKKPIVPNNLETKRNPRSRSAKLRVAEKI